MGVSSLDVGHRQDLKTRVKKGLAKYGLAAVLAASSLAMLEAPLLAGGETRSISMYHMHTGESLTVTYMQDGRYVPSAMKKLNYLLRDWRRKEVTTIDPKTIDLVWELHADLGSRSTINIVCGYRSPRTNAFLKRIGRNVAKKSQHMAGKAIDFYFPDVPTVKIRNSALVRKVGGVGFYRSSGGPTGFLHVDSGHIRHWGPLITNAQMAQIMREGAKSVGRRMSRNRVNDSVAPDAAPSGSGGGLIAALFGKKKVAQPAAPDVTVGQPEFLPEATPVEQAYAGNEDDMADLSADAAVAPAAAKPKPVLAAVVPPSPTVPKDQVAALDTMAQDASNAPAPVEQLAENSVDQPQVKQGFPIPRPRLKPVEIMLMAAANMKADPKFIRITAASGGPETGLSNEAPSQVVESLGTVMAAAAIDDQPAPKPLKKAKADFAAELRDGTTDDAPVIKPLLASAGGSDINWWPQLMLNSDATIRRDGAPSLIGSNEESSLPMAADLSDESNTQVVAEGKGDLLVVNRDGKGDLDGTAVHVGRKLQKLSSN